MPDDDPSAAAIEITALDRIAGIAAADWDACAAPEAADGGRPANPFLTHRFLAALEESGSVGTGTGWYPHHLVARSGGAVAGVMPLYVKGHSQGEYVFDHSWAHAYERAGGRYYPKFQSAVPFTPVTGRRFLARAGGPLPAPAAETALMQGAVQVAAQSGVSSLHVTYCTETEWQAGRAAGYLGRTDRQFHFRNRGYARFDDFLAALASRKRKQIRKERARALADGIRIRRLAGADLRPEHWDAMWHFYQDTGARKWGYPYLTRAFFEIAAGRLADDIVMVMAELDGCRLAGALNVRGRDALYGRYWGCEQNRPCLHFEVCYYQAIEIAIEAGLATVEAGAQGAHKIARGYEPVTTRSLHWFADPALADAVARFLAAERKAVAEESAWMATQAPFRRG